jgi:hypothetical protein
VAGDAGVPGGVELEVLGGARAGGVLGGRAAVVGRHGCCGGVEERGERGGKTGGKRGRR